MATKPISLKYFYKLESESSCTSNDDSESEYSVQGFETELAKDTTDTDTRSESEYKDYEQYEYDSLDRSSSSISEGMTYGHNTLEQCFADCEESDSNSLSEEINVSHFKFKNCLRCNSKNKNPCFRLCRECFKDEKANCLPRPKPHKKSKLHKNSYVKQVYPKLKSTAENCLKLNEFPRSKKEFNRKRQRSESNLSQVDETVRKKIKCECEGYVIEENKIDSDISGKDESNKENFVDDNVPSCSSSNNNTHAKIVKELCLMCNNLPVNSLFIHGKTGHMCCCYKCGVRTWKKFKRCPICNAKLNNIVRVNTMDDFIEQQKQLYNGRPML